MSLEHATSHFYSEEVDEDSQESKTLLDANKKPLTVTPQKRKKQGR